MNRPTRRRTRPALFVAAAAGLGAALVLVPGRDGTAQAPASPGPAARLLPPTVMEPGDKGVVARGAGPEVPLQSVEIRAADPSILPVTRNSMPTAPARTISDVGPFAAPGGPGAKPLAPPRPNWHTVPQPKAAKGSLSGTWDAMKGWLKPPPKLPAQPTNDPYASAVPHRPPAAQPFQPRLPGSNVPPPAGAIPQQSFVPNGEPVVAAPPAYRWYGWGTVTPGQNPYAPAGSYPAASAGWYAQSGATPGAFPVPAVNPVRPPPGSEPPAYAGSTPTANPGLPPPTLSQPIVTPSRPVTIPPPPVVGGPGVPTASAAWTGPRVIADSTRPAASVTPVGFAAGGEPPPTPAPAPTAEVAWQPSAAPAAEPGPAPPSVMLTRSSETAHPWTPPVNTPSVLETKILAVAGQRISWFQIAPSGPNRLLVRFVAHSDGDARSAAKAISNLPELREYTVDFEASVGGR